MYLILYIFFIDTATTEIYTLSLHDALPIYRTAARVRGGAGAGFHRPEPALVGRYHERAGRADPGRHRSEEHTSELQSQSNLVCRLLLEKKKKIPLNQKVSTLQNSYDCHFVN